jgi:hypothetical protein
MGRPSLFAQDLADEICGRLSEGESLRSICKAEQMPHESTVRSWALANTEGFTERYLIARDLGLECKADEFLEVTATPVLGVVKTEGPKGVEVKTIDAVDRSRLHADGLKWYLSHLAPKKYGDRLGLDHSGEIGVRELDDRALSAKIDAIYAAASRIKAGGDDLV